MVVGDGGGLVFWGGRWWVREGDYIYKSIGIILWDIVIVIVIGVIINLGESVAVRLCVRGGGLVEGVKGQ